MEPGAVRPDAEVPPGVAGRPPVSDEIVIEPAQPALAPRRPPPRIDTPPVGRPPVTDDVGGKSSASTQASIGDGGEPPVADAGGPYTGSVGSAVEFDAGGSSDPDGHDLSFCFLIQV